MIRQTASFWGVCTISTVLALDQASKWAAHRSVTPDGSISLLPVLDVAPSFNPGLAFGLASDAGQPLLLIIAAVIVAWLTIMLVRADSMLEATGLGAIIGGALGNALDRVRLGAVRDFIDVHAGNWHWPTFNLADSFIFLGVALLVVPGAVLAMKRRARPHRSGNQGAKHV